MNATGFSPDPIGTPQSKRNTPSSNEKETVGSSIRKRRKFEEQVPVEILKSTSKTPVSEKYTKRKKGKKLVFSQESVTRRPITRSITVHKDIIQIEEHDQPEVPTVRCKGRTPAGQLEMERENIQVKELHVVLKKYQLHNVQLQEELRKLKEEMNMVPNYSKRAIEYSYIQRIGKRSKGKNMDDTQRNVAEVDQLRHQLEKAKEENAKLKAKSRRH